MTTARAPRLEEITPANLEAALALRVRPEQEYAVDPVAHSLAEAYVRPGKAWPRVIVDDGRVVGFVMAFLDIDWRDDGTDVRSGLWRLNIAADEQGKGYGRFAVDAVAEELRRRGSKTLHVTWHPGEHGPENFYLTLGFEKTDERVNEEHVGVLPL
ncbi:GNAT family N-acetyltransferase [Streptomyces sp. CL7]|uniref:GNAT family N-acetyltransferase n=1 Tax=Streptomyces sp. CL7 TaxID=3096006 RepID=UPI002A74FD29|nr:GNAT family N-acetyltransferase [Streptomyces sp. CL7]WPP30596.1 GNAT family N-acetyltransferase [Streptomyces sp. CL7]